MTTTRRPHPSVRFQNGEVRDFQTAMVVYLDQYREELTITRELVRKYPSDDPGKDSRAIQEQADAVADIEQAVQQARQIYREEVDAAIARAAIKMRETNDYHLRLIADALERNEWSTLAI